jgi:hypothetical protein
MSLANFLFTPGLQRVLGAALLQPDRSFTPQELLRLVRQWARVAEAAREVQAASAALEQHFDNAPDMQPSTLQLARFAAAMQGLKEARNAFDALLSRSSDS